MTTNPTRRSPPFLMCQRLIVCAFADATLATSVDYHLLPYRLNDAGAVLTTPHQPPSMPLQLPSLPSPQPVPMPPLCSSSSCSPCIATALRVTCPSCDGESLERRSGPSTIASPPGQGSLVLDERGSSVRLGPSFGLNAIRGKRPMRSRPSDLLVVVCSFERKG